jgi:hypothetical protein
MNTLRQQPHMSLDQTKMRVGSTHFQWQDGRETDKHLENGMRLKKIAAQVKQKQIRFLTCSVIWKKIHEN